MTHVNATWICQQPEYESLQLAPARTHHSTSKTCPQRRLHCGKMPAGNDDQRNQSETDRLVCRDHTKTRGDPFGSPPSRPQPKCFPLKMIFPSVIRKTSY